jgi:hypothetical protein
MTSPEFIYALIPTCTTGGTDSIKPDRTFEMRLRFAPVRPPEVKRHRMKGRVSAKLSNHIGTNIPRNTGPCLRRSTKAPMPQFTICVL